MNQLPDYLTISNHPLTVLESLIKEWNPDHVAVLVDENTRTHCLPVIEPTDGHIIEINSGEENKTIDTCNNVWDQLTQAGFTRKSLLINLGGGVIGDLGGFCAATYKRGMRFINLPTTLLSQVDASIGGKLGVDFGTLKNHIGVFKEPDHVIIHPGFLHTLSERELKSGYSEVLKHALIADKDQWQKLKLAPVKDQNWDELIPASVKIKNQIVKADPVEKGLRKILNFGHTLGHALESFYLHTAERLLHGEAIAIGMILESHLSLQKGWISGQEFEEINSTFQSIFSLPEKLPKLDQIMESLLQDKKNDQRGINFSILKEIGSCEHDVQADEGMIQQSLEIWQRLR